jgi:hypothetical protein
MEGSLVLSEPWMLKPPFTMGQALAACSFAQLQITRWKNIPLG